MGLFRKAFRIAAKEEHQRGERIGGITGAFARLRVIRLHVGLDLGTAGKPIGEKTGAFDVFRKIPADTRLVVGGELFVKIVSAGEVPDSGDIVRPP